MAFPLIFSGTVMESLIIKGFGLGASFWIANIVTITTATALFLLLYFAKKDRFYPAMPFVTAGCVAGYLIVLLF